VTKTRIAASGRNFTINRIGSVFCLCFTENPVWNIDDAKSGDAEAFRKFFHGCMADGVYFAPSPCEAGFLSTAHRD